MLRHLLPSPICPILIIVMPPAHQQQQIVTAWQDTQRYIPGQQRSPTTRQAEWGITGRLHMLMARENANCVVPGARPPMSPMHLTYSFAIAFDKSQKEQTALRLTDSISSKLFELRSMPFADAMCITARTAGYRAKQQRERTGVVGEAPFWHRQLQSKDAFALEQQMSGKSRGLPQNLGDFQHVFMNHCP